MTWDCESVLGQALACAGDGAFAVTSDGSIVMWNRAAEDLLGYSADEARGRHCCDLFAGRDARGNPLCDEGCHVIMLVKRGEAVQSFDLETRTKAGHPIWINVSTLGVSTGGLDGELTVHLFRPTTAPGSEGSRPERIGPHGRTQSADGGLRSASAELAGVRRARCLVILPRERASELDVVKRYFADADCDVILDRREPRGGGGIAVPSAFLEERRSGRLESSGTAVIFVN